MQTAYRLVVLDQGLSSDRLELSPVTTEAVAETAATGEPVIVIRRQAPYLLLGPQDRRLPTIGDAAAWAEAVGVPTYMRIGGGSAVLIDNHCLSFGVARPCRDLTTLEQNYRELAGPVVEALQGFGIPARFGAAAGSFCEGPWDIVAEGQKIAGIAQAIRAGYALVSGMILIDQDPVQATGFVQEIYRRAGSATILDPSAVTNLTTLLGRSMTHAELTTRLQGAFANHFPVYKDELRPHEWIRAAELVALRRFPAPGAVTAGPAAPRPGA
jgi:octanoyl-[GcvH]:protein N-octanoyltransferase